MRMSTKWIAVLGVFLAAVGASACIPDPAHTCQLSDGRTAVQACIDGSAESKLLGSATWSLSQAESGLVIRSGKTVVLAKDAKINARYTVDNGQSIGVLVDGGKFYMDENSSITNQKATLTSTYRTQEENRVGVTVKNGGYLEMYKATVVAAGYGIYLTGGAGNELHMDGGVAWGAGGIVSVPTGTSTNTIYAASATILGTLGPVIIEPLTPGPLTLANIQNNNFIDGDKTDSYFRNSMGYIGVIPASHNSAAVLDTRSTISNNTGGSETAIVVAGCAPMAALVHNNTFGVSSLC